MNGLDFPAVSPVIFTIGPLAVRWYSMAYLFGILIGWFLLTRNVRKNALALTKENIEDLVFYITLGVILALWYFSRKIKYPFLGLTDLVVLYAPPL